MGRCMQMMLVLRVLRARRSKGFDLDLSALMLRVWSGDEDGVIALDFLH